MSGAARPPSLKKATSFGATGMLAVVCVLVLIDSLPQLSRPGYSVDEEFTVFAVRGITANNLPLLPSGLLYDRGLAYSYASWAARVVSGAELPAYRALALISAIASLVVIFRTLQRHASTNAAIIAVALVAASIPFWAVATSGRFYAPFLATYLGLVGLVGRLGLVGRAGTVGNWLGLFAVAASCRLLHELAFTSVAIPFLCLILSPKGSRSRWLMPLVAIVAGLLTAQAALFAIHFLAPSSGETMVRRFFLWQVINLFEVPPDRQFGIPLVVLVIAWLIAPQRARLNSVIALCVFALILSFSLTRALAAEPFSLALLTKILQEGSRYPLDMFWHTVRLYPVSIGVVLALLVARLAGAGGEWRPIERAAHMLWVGWVLWFGVIESGITVNYLLLPVSLMLVAIAIDLMAILQHNIDRIRTAGKLVSAAASALVIAAIAADQWRGEGPLSARLEAARPTISVPGIEEIRSSLQPGDRVVCTDELACLMLLGRIDVWLALDDYVRERFVVTIADGRLAGVYTGLPAVFRPADLFEGQPAERTIVVDVFKEYAVGNSRTWLPRALDRDGIEARILLQTPQVRVVEISPPIQHARREDR
jgi:hypothetical protein